MMEIVLTVIGGVLVAAILVVGGLALAVAAHTYR